MNDVVVNWFVCTNLIVWYVSSGGQPFFWWFDTRFIRFIWWPTNSSWFSTRFILACHLIAGQIFVFGTMCILT